MAVARGARVFATASPANHDWLRELGAEPLDYHDEDICARVREEGGADAAIDLFGGEGRKQALACLRSGGRLVSIASPPPEPSDVAETHYVFVRPSGFDLHELAELVEDGRLKPHVEEAFPLERAADAHERIEGGHTRGKLVLSVS
jgi:NADPH:quinone reductase-like Zn-dependent oxidoreductase